MSEKKKLKILSLSAFIGVTGAGIAFERIISAQKKYSQNEIFPHAMLNNTEEAVFKKIKKKWNYILWKKKAVEVGPKHGEFISPFHTQSYKLTRNFDIIHLHWHGFGSLPDPKVFEGMPVIITHHDYWWFTGGCHYPLNCIKQSFCCNSCPITSKGKDLSKDFLKKQSLLQKKNWSNAFVSYNQKQKTQKEGTIIGNVLPNYAHIDRKCYNLKKEYDILYVAAAFNTDKRKGFSHLIDITKKIKKRCKIVIVGDTISLSLKRELSKIHDINCVSAILEKKMLDDVMLRSRFCLVTSLDETFGQVSCEAAANFCIPLGFKNTGFESIFYQFENLILSLDQVCENGQKLEKMLSLNNNYDLAERLYFHIKNLFSAQKIAYDYDKLYDAVAK